MSCVKGGKVNMNNEKRRNEAQALSGMGFPIRLAYYALEINKDNGDAAVDWLLSSGIAHTESTPDVDWLGINE
jgi:hypothetical protein